MRLYRTLHSATSGYAATLNARKAGVLDTIRLVRPGLSHRRPASYPRESPDRGSPRSPVTSPQARLAALCEFVLIFRESQSPGRALSAVIEKRSGSCHALSRCRMLRGSIWSCLEIRAGIATRRRIWPCIRLPSSKHSRHTSFPNSRLATPDGRVADIPHTGFHIRGKRCSAAAEAFALTPRHFARKPGVRSALSSKSGFQMALPGYSFFATQVITEPASVTMISNSSPLVSMAKKACDVIPKGAIWTV
jgi:hypothetical protein